MKRFLALLMAMLMTFSVSLAVACGGDNGDSTGDNGGQTHTHSYENWTSIGGGKHTGTCAADGVSKTENCSGTTTCTKCGAELSSTPVTPDNPDNPDPGTGGSTTVPDVDFGEVPEKIDVGTYNKEGAGKTVINVVNMHGGIGSVWLDQAAERYAKIMANASYATGKKGVYIKINKRMGVSGMVAQAATSVEHVFFAERKCAPNSWGEGGVIMNLDEIVKDTTREGGTLESKIYDTAKAAMIGTVDGEKHYYAIPHYEFHGGASYNREIFDEYGAYFADLEKCNPEYIYPYESRFGTIYLIAADFINEDDAVKHPGPDGLYDTEDDGLPVSFEDYVSLCEYFKVGCEIAPIVLSGMCENYSNYYIAGLWASLGGQDQMKTYYDFNGKLEVVTGYTNEPILPGIDYIKKPITEWVDVTPATGYYGNQMVAKYYAHAMIEIFHKEGYFAEKELGSNTTHLDAQKTLIYGGKATKADNSKAAMLIEASYWYNESEENLCLENYVTLTGDTHEVDVRHMALPNAYTTAQWNARITQEEYDKLSAADKIGKEVHEASAIIDIGQAYCMVNNNIKDNPEIRNAVIDFVKFVYSEREIRYFTMETGMPRAIAYDLSEAQQDYMGNYYKRLWNLRDWETGANIIYVSPGANPDPTTMSVFTKAKVTIQIELAGATLTYAGANSPYHKLKDLKKNADGTYQTGTAYCFEVSTLSLNAWRGFAGELLP